jgi:two-component system cell cycle sensor histidine kinase/response regulator CckA
MTAFPFDAGAPGAPAGLRATLLRVAPYVVGAVAVGGFAFVSPQIGAIGAAAGGVATVAVLAVVSDWRARAAAAEGQRLKTFLAAFAADPAARLVIDSSGQPFYVNDSFRRLFGRAEAAPVEALFAGDENSIIVVRRLAHAVAVGASSHDRVQADVHGRRTWLDVGVSPAADGASVWSFTDATAAQEMAEASHEEQSQFADFIDNAPVGFYSVDAQGAFLFANSTMANWLGRSVADLTGGKIRLADVIVSAAPVERLLRPAESGPVDAEVKLRHADGSLRPVHIMQNVSTDPQTGVRTRSVVSDLTHEQEWRDTFRLVEEHFHRFFDLAPIGIVTVDQEGAVLEANAAFQKIVGGGEVVGRRFTDMLVADDGAEVRRRLEAAKEGGGVLDVRFKPPSDRSGQLYFSRLEETGASGRASFLLHFLDATEQKNLEVQFAQSQKMQAVGQLAGGIAHDFNNLLTAMIGFCDLLLVRHQPGEESFADIMQIKQNASRAANLVRQLLAFSRQQTLRPQVLDITDVLADLRNLLSRLIGEKIELRMLHGREIGPVKVDRGQFEQVVINLAVNARDAMDQGGTLTIRTANITAGDSVMLGHELMPPGEYVMIEVVDTGKGIPKEIMGKIFEPFFTTKEVGAGTGLGLSTVYGIVKQTGGFVFPESETGRGATFRIYLPRHKLANENEREPEDVQRASRDLTGKGTILLVEDEDAVRTFAARALRNKGYTVLEANSGESALALLGKQSSPIDLLISDVVMPNMDGPTLVGRIREARPDLKIVFISGYAEDAFRKTMEQQDDIAFLPKPFSLSQLAVKVKEVLREAS